MKQTSELEVVIKELKDALKVFNKITEIKPNDKDVLEKLEKFVVSASNLSSVFETLNDIITRAKDIIAKEKEKMSYNFKLIESELIMELKEKGVPLRECSDGWRIKSIQLKTKPQSSTVSISYNNQTIIGWTRVNSKEDIKSLIEEAEKLLFQFLMPKDELIDIFWDAYKYARFKSGRDVVSIFDFYTEVRLLQIRRYLEKNKPDAKITKYTEFPKWAFLYNLDIYRSIWDEIPKNKRLALQTGSMQETMQGKGMYVNGLNPDDDYKIMCYVYETKEGV
ncbi:hypothetical protein Calkro_1046 [Caldicellulosiruptor kronotskyensis 2002]|uniref:Uncharacterized protein n=1 Tax=Caldicellulosiruptor kronotskyensis (strain DSM 18902 / VKM B-2412 / 2002) TaxID=632348 RepID=E4SCI3_CALK2|nr:hypothetical protein [Caldicellulosiruptor kronotskyensis]ADQ45917.1 hypothetical protein Calkro_1046 [Caldicellulosiruptor kronotskyensis 2002]